MVSTSSHSIRAFNTVRGREGDTPGEAVTPRSFVPSPDKEDYLRGWIERYFVRKVNDISAPIFETDESQFEALQEDNYWISVSIRWRLTGIETDVRKTNEEVLELADEELYGMINRLPDLSQYYTKDKP